MSKDKRDLILAAHREGAAWGASSVAAMAGIDPRVTPLDVYLDKAMPRDPDEEAERDEEEMEPWQEWGWDLEPNVLRKAADVSGEPILGLDWSEEPALFWPGRKRPYGRRTAQYRKIIGAELEALVTGTVRHPTLPLMTHPDGIGFSRAGTAWRPFSSVRW